MSVSESLDLAGRGAEIIVSAFDVYTGSFREITRRARAHFEQQDWHATQRDSALRLDLYVDTVNAGLESLRGLLGDRLESRPLWTAVRSAYERRLADRGDDDDLAETFFNSITRRILHTIGVDPAVEFVVPASPYVRAFGRPWSLSVGEWP